MALDTTLLTAAITGLAGAIGVLWKQVYAFHRHTEKKLEECEDDRKALWERIAGDEPKSDQEAK